MRARIQLSGFPATDDDSNVCIPNERCIEIMKTSSSNLMTFNASAPKIPGPAGTNKISGAIRLQIDVATTDMKTFYG